MSRENIHLDTYREILNYGDMLCSRSAQIGSVRSKSENDMVITMNQCGYINEKDGKKYNLIGSCKKIPEIKYFFATPTNEYGKEKEKDHFYYEIDMEKLLTVIEDQNKRIKKLEDKIEELELRPGSKKVELLKLEFEKN